MKTNFKQPTCTNTRGLQKII